MGSNLVDRMWLDFATKAASAVETSAAEICSPGRIGILERTKGWFGSPRRGGPLKGAKIPLENSFTHAIWKRLEEVQDMQVIHGHLGGPYPDISDMAFSIEQPPPRPDGQPEPAVGNRAKRTDLRLQIAKSRLDMRMEAKIVLNERSLLRNYLGSGGLQRFDDKKVPYTTMPYGMMVGYVVDDTPGAWMGRLETVMQQGGSPQFQMQAFGADRRLTTKHELPPGCRASHVHVIHLMAKMNASYPPSGSVQG